MNRLFKSCIALCFLIVSVVTLRVATGGAEPSSIRNFVLTNDANTTSNTVTALGVKKGGALTVVGKLKTEGQGAGGSYASNHDVLMTFSGQCIFASDGASGDIAAFRQMSKNPPKYKLIGNFSGPNADDLGIGLAMDFNQHWLYAAYSVAPGAQLRVWSINSDCSLGSGGQSNYTYSLEAPIEDMTALANSSALLVTYPDYLEVGSFKINADGSLTANGTQNGSHTPSGIIANSAATYAITTTSNSDDDAVEVWPLNPDGSLQAGTYYNFASQSGSVASGALTWDNGANPQYIYVSNEPYFYNGNPNTIMILKWAEPVPTFSSVFTPKGNSHYTGVFSKSDPIPPSNTTLVYLAESPNLIGVFRQGPGTLTELPTSPGVDPNSSDLTSIFAFPYPINYQ
jgi:hypothetical protein